MINTCGKIADRYRFSNSQTFMKLRDRPKTESRPQSKTNTKFFLILLIVFCILSVIGIFHHEMWRDELEAWLIANNSNSIPELLNNLRYTGHPALWYICLYFITRFTDNLLAMQIFHLIIAIGFVSLFLFYSPFSKIQKLLFCFSYFILYEYTIISRNYGLGVLFLFAFCILYRYRDRSYLPLAFILFLLSHTNAYTLIIGFTLALTLVIDAYFNHEQRRQLYRQRWTVTASIIIYLLGLITSIIQTIPPSDAFYHGDLISVTSENTLYTTGEAINSSFFHVRKFAQSFAAIWKSYVAIPDLSVFHFHNSNIFYMLSNGTANIFENTVVLKDFNLLNLLIYPSSILILIIVAIALSRQPIILFFYFITNCALISFYYFIRIPGTRHAGHLFIVFIVSLWLSTNYKHDILPIKLKPKFFNKIVSHKYFILTLFLGLHLIGGVHAYTKDILEPFSGSKPAVEYIKKHHYDRLLIVGSPDVKAAPFSALLNKKIYYPERAGFGTYTVWTNEQTTNNTNITHQEILEQVANLINNDRPKILLILNEKLTSNIYTVKIEPLTQFEFSIAEGETYYLYLVTKN